MTRLSAIPSKEFSITQPRGRAGRSGAPLINVIPRAGDNSLVGHISHGSLKEFYSDFKPSSLKQLSKCACCGLGNGGSGADPDFHVEVRSRSVSTASSSSHSPPLSFT
jgi:hypothetical protein